MAAGAASSGAPDRHLVRPSPSTPWEIQVVSLVPQFIHDLWKKQNKLPSNGIIHGAWCVVTISSRIYVWNAQDNCTCLYHPNLKCTAGQSLLITIQEGPSTVHIFAMHPTKGDLAVWQLPAATTSTKQRASLLPKSPNARVKVQLDPGDTVTCLQAISGNTLYVGTKQSNVYEVAVSVRPLVLKAERLIRATSLWKRMGLSSSGVKPDSPIVAVVESNENPVYSITKSGVVEEWDKDGEGKPKVSLMSLLEHNQDTKGTVGIDVMKASVLDGNIDMVVKMLRKARSRVYWVRLSMGASGIQMTNAVFLNRFRESVHCPGFVTAANGVSYAAFQYEEDDGPVLVALNADSSEPRELDLPKHIPKVVTMGNDVVTHGCSIVSSEGLMVRARYVQMQAPVVRQLQQIQPQVATGMTLSNHLRSTFWHAYQRSITSVQLPPSLQSASPQDIEQAVLLTAEHLQKENGAKMTWHESFLDLIQQCGLYRQLSIGARWKLLGIGQEYVVQASMKRPTEAYQISRKLLQTQQHALEFSPSEMTEWTALLVTALKAAQSYRDDKGASLYDAFTNPSHLWTHSGEMQTVLKKQLLAYQSGKALKKPSEVSVIVRAALLSYQETNHPDYEPIKILAIPLIEKDLEAFQVSKEHSWYEGLCMLALKHPNEPRFGLESIVREDALMGHFVLKWHTDKDKLGHVFRYGELLPPAEFDAFLAQEPKLKQHRWIHAIDTDNFDQATNLLLSTGQQRNKMGDAQFALSMARLTCKVAEETSPTVMVTDEDDDDDDDGHDDDEDMEEEPKSKRLRSIVSKLDLMHAQQVLLDGDTDDNKNTGDNPPMPTSQLLQMAFDKLRTHESPIVMAMAALSIARADLEENPSSNMAIHVWAKVLQFDWESKWSVWINSPVPRNTVLQETLFGQLWMEVQEQSVDHHVVQYDASFETPVLRLLGAGGNLELKRMLQSVITINISKSLMVESF